MYYGVSWVRGRGVEGRKDKECLCVVFFGWRIPAVVSYVHSSARDD